MRTDLDAVLKAIMFIQDSNPRFDREEMYAQLAIRIAEDLTLNKASKSQIYSSRRSPTAPNSCDSQNLGGSL